MKKDVSKIVEPVKPKIEGTYGGTYKKNLQNISKISDQEYKRVEFLNSEKG